MDQTADAQTARIEDIGAVRTLRDRIVVDLAPGLPVDEIEAVLVTRTGNERFPRASLRASASTNGGQIVTITADLSRWLDAPDAQLQLWIGRYLIYQDRLFPEGTTLSGRIESISDYALTGWAANLRGEELPEGELLLDHASVARFVVSGAASDEDGVGSRFCVPLPSQALNGASHTLQVRFGKHVLAPLVWRAAPRFRVLRAEPGELRLWFCDLAMADGPTTITVSADDTTIFQGHTIPAAPMAAAPSHRVIRFEARFDLPHTARHLDIRAGGLGQLPLASYEVISADRVTEAAREAAAALLRLERGLGRHLGWDRGALAALRTSGDAEATLGRALSPIRSARTRGVSVIVPIYKGLDETRACLESLHANALSGADPALREIILIDDCSPEPGMAELIARFSGAVGQCEIQVISNPENLGFVGTVNHGISLAQPDSDIILLNADTVVPTGFATRLQKAAQHDPRTASVTPLSNNATILSLPDANAVNDIGAADVPALDEFLRARRRGETLEIPTGVGFCLFLARDALDDVGGFGMEWGRGYGEEVDWCLRARDRGWINVAALDVFVLHFGSVSFGSDERRAILERNHAQLERRYPEYIAQVQAFLRTDALAHLRRAVFFHLLAKDSAPRLIHLLHGMGGGTMTYVDSITALTGAQGRTNLIVMPRHDDWLGRDEFEIRWTGRNLSLRVSPDELPGVLTELGKAQGRFILHAVIGIGPALYEVIAASALPYSIVVHDYQWFCPRVVLIDPNGRYCGEPPPHSCQICIQGHEIYDFGADSGLIRTDIRKWLGKNAALLEGAASILSPSRDTAQRLQAHFDLPNVRVLPHPERIETARIIRTPDDDTVTRIAIVGGINIAKGAAVVRDLAHRAARQEARLTLRVIGDIVGREALGDFPNIQTTGRYAHADLPRLVSEFDPHFVFFPGVWPETYCYVLSEIWDLGYPAVCLDIGAIAERIRETGAGVVLPYDHEAELLLPRLLAARAEVAKLVGLRFRIGRARPDLEPLLGAPGAARRQRRKRA